MAEKLVLWEVLKLMAENTRRKAECEGGEIEIREGNLVWKHTGELMSVHYNATGRWNTLTEKRWTIIEPPKELKKMSFGEAFKYYRKNKVIESFEQRKFDFPSCSDYLNLEFATDTEINNLWTVEGILRG